jgi:hypothetical protein
VTALTHVKVGPEGALAAFIFERFDIIGIIIAKTIDIINKTIIISAIENALKNLLIFFISLPLFLKSILKRAS